jgi:hypothetical protein
VWHTSYTGHRRFRPPEAAPDSSLDHVNFNNVSFAMFHLYKTVSLEHGTAHWEAYGLPVITIKNHCNVATPQSIIPTLIRVEVPPHATNLVA